MPGLTGLQFIQSLNERPMIILITAYEKFALEGFNYDVVDYLVKPVSLNRFVKACNKAWELYQLKAKSKEPATDKSPDDIFVNADYSLLKVVIDDIMWVEGLKDYIKIHIRNSSKPVITRMTMKSVEELLPANRFIRIHKSYIAAMDFITAIRKTTVMIGSLELPVSDTYQEKLMKLTGK
jgi:DNA-binding LytR/AlgR family response regulator